MELKAKGADGSKFGNSRSVRLKEKDQHMALYSADKVLPHGGTNKPF